MKFINEVFDIVEYSYRLTNKWRFKSRNSPTVRYGTETPAFVGSRIASYIPNELK